MVVRSRQGRPLRVVLAGTLARPRRTAPPWPPPAAAPPQAGARAITTHHQGRRGCARRRSITVFDAAAVLWGLGKASDAEAMAQNGVAWSAFAKARRAAAVGAYAVPLRSV